MRLLFKFAGEDISVHKEMARIRAERAEEQKAGIIQPLPTSDFETCRRSGMGKIRQASCPKKDRSTLFLYEDHK